jgi:predicted transcriptional regulator
MTEEQRERKLLNDRLRAQRPEQKERDRTRHLRQNMTLEQIEHQKETKKQYYNKNKEKILAQRRFCAAIETQKKKKYSYGKQYHLKVKFGITPEQYNEMFVNQEGRCAVCGKHQKELKTVLAVDHDHVTEEIRGLLCGPCNMGLGMFRDDPILLQKAIDYLRKDNKLRLVSGLD